MHGRPIERKQCILVLEDDLEMRSSLSRILRDAGYDVRVGDPSEVDLAGEHEVALTLVGGSVFRSWGTELSARLRGCPLVLMTLMPPPVTAGSRALGEVDAVLERPFEEVDLLAVVGRFVGPPVFERSSG